MNIRYIHPADQLVMFMQRIYDKGLTTTSGGNLSILDEEGNIWITPAGVDKGTLNRNDIVCVKPILPMPNLPVARVMWKAMPNLTDGVECWITAGGAHHTVLSYDVTAEQMKDWARMMDIEFVHITKDTTVDALEKELFLNDLAWKLK